MKNQLFIYIFITLLGYISFAQQEFKIIDKNSNEPIPNATVSFLNGKGTYTDINGIFSLNKFAKDSLEITAIGYKTKKIAIPLSSVIYLDSEITELEEVKIKNLKTKILKHKSGFNNINIVVRDFTYNEFVCTYIPFPVELDSTDTIKIKNIVVNTTGLRSKKRRYYPFKVNLFSSNNEYKHPKLEDSLLTGIITSRKKGQSNIVKIDISDYDLTLSKKGIFISFETLSKSEYPQKNLYKFHKIFMDKKNPYTDYAAAVKTLKINPDKNIYSYQLIKYKSIEGDSKYWKKEKDRIYDLTLEIEY